MSIFIGITPDLAYASSTLANRFEMIGLLGGRTSSVIVLKDKSNEKIHYLNSGDNIPGQDAIVKKLPDKNQIVIVERSGKITRLSFYAHQLQSHSDDKRLKKWAELKAYVMPYLKEENIILDEDPSDQHQDLLGIPMGTSEDVTEYVLLEHIRE